MANKPNTVRPVCKVVPLSVISLPFGGIQQELERLLTELIHEHPEYRIVGIAPTSDNDPLYLGKKVILVVLQLKDGERDE